MNCSDVDLAMDGNESIGNVAKEEFQPLNDKILVRVAIPKEVKKGDLYIPEVAVEKPLEGIVVAFGPGKIHPVHGQYIPIGVNVGDRVVFGKYSGNECVINEERLLLLQGDELFGYFKKK